MQVRCLSRCLSGSYDRTCKIWDVDSGKELKTLSGHQNVVYSVGFNFPSWFVITILLFSFLKPMDIGTAANLDWGYSVFLYK